MQKHSVCSEVFVLGQVLLLVAALTSPGLAVSDMPLRLSIKYHDSEHSLDVAVVTTEEITLSNYDIWLDWDASACTLRSIVNGQSLAFSNFQSNANAGDPNAGKISGMSSGKDVTVGADEVLATYSFSVTDGGTDTLCAFTLTVKNVADESGSSLPWKGGCVHETTEQKIRWIAREGPQITCSVFCLESDATLYCVAYSDSGQMVAIRAAQVEAVGEQKYEFDLNGARYDYAECFFLDGSFRPKCVSKRN